jgi:hypothetical protein
MTEPPKQPSREAELNPAMRQRREERYDTEHSTPPPVESASVQREEGKGWPTAWLIVTIIGVLIAIYLIFF